MILRTAARAGALDRLQDSSRSIWSMICFTSGSTPSSATGGGGAGPAGEGVGTGGATSEPAPPPGPAPPPAGASAASARSRFVSRYATNDATRMLSS